MVICNSIGHCHLCKGCGAAVPHEKISCEPCPLLKDAKCVALEVVASYVYGFSLMNRGFSLASDGNNLLLHNVYDIYREPSSGKYIIHNSQP